MFFLIRRNICGGGFLRASSSSRIRNFFRFRLFLQRLFAWTFLFCELFIFVHELVHERAYESAHDDSGKKKDKRIAFVHFWWWCFRSCFCLATGEPKRQLNIIRKRAATNLFSTIYFTFVRHFPKSGISREWLRTLVLGREWPGCLLCGLYLIEPPTTARAPPACATVVPPEVSVIL